jgi:hypothetical protein
VSAKSPETKQPGSAEGSASAKDSSDGRRVETKRDPDVAIVCGVSDDGTGVEIIRRRGERIEAGTVRRLEQGKPIHGEVVRLRPREHFPLICDVEVEVPRPAQAEASRTEGSLSTSGPAQVATETYRKNWDAVYGRSKKQRSLLN